jgi:hypothetical protein
MLTFPSRRSCFSFARATLTSFARRSAIIRRSRERADEGMYRMLEGGCRFDSLGLSCVAGTDWGLTALPLRAPSPLLRMRHTVPASSAAIPTTGDRAPSRCRERAPAALVATAV